MAAHTHKYIYTYIHTHTYIHTCPGTGHYTLAAHLKLLEGLGDCFGDETADELPDAAHSVVSLLQRGFEGHAGQIICSTNNTLFLSLLFAYNTWHRV